MTFEWLTSCIKQQDDITLYLETHLHTCMSKDFKHFCIDLQIKNSSLSERADRRGQNARPVETTQFN